jgi:hypothetical protein
MIKSRRKGPGNRKFESIRRLRMHLVVDEHAGAHFVEGKISEGVKKSWNEEELD